MTVDPETPKKRSRLRTIAADILGTRMSPARTAASLAVGMAVGMSPFVGLHFLIAITLSFLLRLNRLAACVGTFIFNPWTAVPIVFAQLGLGSMVLHTSMPHLQVPPNADWSTVLAALHPFFVRYLIGGTVLSGISGVLSYPALYWAILFLRRHRPTGRR
ncbi:MAG: DUF2062 domain-containing protein [Acidobacteriota bacterium]